MKQKPKRYSPDEKMVILRRHLLVPISELCREHDPHPNVFYRWQKEFFEGGATAFGKESSAQIKHLTKQVAALEGQFARKNEVLAEVTEAYVRIKKQLWSALRGRWVKPEVREAVVELVDYGITRVGMPLKRRLRWLRLARGKYYDWKRRQGQPNRHNGQIPSRHWLQPWEREASVAYAGEHPLDGYRAAVLPYDR
ncbi:MAG: transposase [Pyrinomonadaceae bacterium]